MRKKTAYIMGLGELKNLIFDNYGVEIEPEKTDYLIGSTYMVYDDVDEDLSERDLRVVKNLNRHYPMIIRSVLHDLCNKGIIKPGLYILEV